MKLLLVSSSANKKARLLSDYFVSSGVDCVYFEKKNKFYFPKFINDFLFNKKINKISQERKVVGFGSVLNTDLLFVKSGVKSNNEFIKSSKKIAVVSKAQKQKFVAKEIKKEDEIAYFYPFFSRACDGAVQNNDKKIISTYIENPKKSGIDEFLKIINSLENKNCEVVIGCKEILQVQLEFYVINIKNIKIKIEPIKNENSLCELFLRSDICIFPLQNTSFEDFVVDAMYSKNAVFVPVSNDSCEILDFFATISANDDAQIGYKISALLNNDEELENIKTENYEIAQGFSIEKTAEKIKRVLF